jgi:glycosyltransferase involved in cell wall biosynthesis
MGEAYASKNSTTASIHRLQIMQKSICLISHSCLSSNSGKHIVSIANELLSNGFPVSVVSPTSDLEFIERLTKEIDHVSYDEIYSFGLAPRHIELAWLWSPRGKVAKIHKAIALLLNRDLPYVLHLEDNDIVIASEMLGIPLADLAKSCISNELDFSDDICDPRASGELVNNAIGITVLSKDLLKAVPKGMPSYHFWPGFDKAYYEYSHLSRLRLREELGISRDTHIIAYTGNVHPANVFEVRSLYVAIALANRMGVNVKLVRTGDDYVQLFDDEEWQHIQSYVISLGRVDANRIKQIQSSSSILVQPGLVDAWNEGRVPCKLPEYLATSRPVIVPNANIASNLSNGWNAIILDQANAESILAALLTYLNKTESLDQIGIRGCLFARKNLDWVEIARGISRFFDSLPETC